MGEMADDAYDRALDEMMDGGRDDYDDMPIWWGRSLLPAQRAPQTVASADDFDAIPDDDV